MKRIALFIFALFTCAIAHATTETINWYMDGNTYATTTCQTGGDIILPTAPTKYGYTFNGWLGYTPIEYLESTGTQYIDTGFMPDQDSGMEIDFRLSLSGASTTYRVAVVVEGDNRFGIQYAKSSDRFYSYAGTTSNSNTWMIDNIYTHNPTDKYYFSINKTNAELKTSTGITRTHTFTNTTYAITVPLYLFALNRDGVMEQTQFNLQIYACKLYDNGTLVRDFIPVLDMNGTPCMFDKVEGKFYYNQGTGQFIAGPAI